MGAILIWRTFTRIEVNGEPRGNADLAMIICRGFLQGLHLLNNSFNHADPGVRRGSET